jgi:hypothetical protein
MDLRKSPGFKPSFHYEYLPDVIDPVITKTVTLYWNNGTSISVKLATTRPNYGGTRYWFKCPHCNRRVRKLYAGAGIGVLACRTCFGLVYDSQYRKGPRFAWYRQIRKLMG